MPRRRLPPTERRPRPSIADFSEPPRQRRRVGLGPAVRRKGQMQFREMGRHQVKPRRSRQNRAKIRRVPSELVRCDALTRDFVVGLPGFEPGTSASRTQRANQAAPQPVRPPGGKQVSHLSPLIRGSFLRLDGGAPGRRTWPRLGPPAACPSRPPGGPSGPPPRVRPRWGCGRRARTAGRPR
jgi:hypothetical protein